MNRIFLAYLVNNGKVIEKDGYDIIVEEVDDNKYSEIITGKIYENYRYSNDNISICLCLRLDLSINYKYITNYFKYESERIKKITEGLELKKLHKSKYISK